MILLSNLFTLMARLSSVETTLNFSSCLMMRGTELWFLFGSVDFEKRVLKPNRPVFWSLSRYKELKITRKPFRGRTFRGLLVQVYVQNISLGSSSFFLVFFFCCCCFFEISILEPALPLSSGTGNKSSPKPESQNIDSGLIVPAWS